MSASRTRSVQGSSISTSLLRPDPRRTPFDVLRALQMICLAYCIWRPVSHGGLLYGAVTLIFLTSVAIILRDDLTIPTWIVRGTGCILLAATFGAVVGALNANPGTFQQAIQWLIAPIVWATFAASQTRRSAPLLVKVTIVSLGFSAFLMFLYFGTRLGLPALLPSAIADQQGAGLNIHHDSTAFRWYGLSSLAAGAPFLVLAAVRPKDSWLPRQRVMVLAALFSCLVALYSGRRAVLLVVLVALALLPLIRRHREVKDAVLPLMTAGLLAALLSIWLFAQSFAMRLLAPALTGAQAYLGTADSTTLNADDAPRADEARELLHSFMGSPLWGHGLGSTTPGFSRNDERPWSFELQLHLALMNLGIIGCALIVYALAVWCMTWRRLRSENPQHSSSLDAAGVGCIALAIADLTNPYLQAVGHGWGVALSAGLFCALGRPTSNAPGRAHAVTRWNR